MTHIKGGGGGFARNVKYSGRSRTGSRRRAVTVSSLQWSRTVTHPGAYLLTDLFFQTFPLAVTDGGLHYVKGVLRKRLKPGRRSSWRTSLQKKVRSIRGLLEFRKPFYQRG